MVERGGRLLKTSFVTQAIFWSETPVPLLAISDVVVLIISKALKCRHGWPAPL